MRRGFTWLDMGTHESLIEASQFVQTIQKRQGYNIACPEEIAYRKKWINIEILKSLSESIPNNNYAKYLVQLTNEL